MHALDRAQQRAHDPFVCAMVATQAQSDAVAELNRVIRYLHEHNKRSTTDLKLKVRCRTLGGGTCACCPTLRPLLCADSACDKHAQAFGTRCVARQAR